MPTGINVKKNRAVTAKRAKIVLEIVPSCCELLPGNYLRVGYSFSSSSRKRSAIVPLVAAHLTEALSAACDVSPGQSSGVCSPRLPGLPPGAAAVSPCPVLESASEDGVLSALPPPGRRRQAGVFYCLRGAALVSVGCCVRGAGGGHWTRGVVV